MDRGKDIGRFYTLLDRLEKKLGGKRKLRDCDGSKKMNWPRRGVYFFFEDGENRSDTGNGPRVVRVGTHAVRHGADTEFWYRLMQHRGTIRGSRPGGGNRGSSVFRYLLGDALGQKAPEDFPDTWGGPTNPAIRDSEHPHEMKVSEVIRSMSFLWLEVGDEPGPHNLRAQTERNAIALLSNYERSSLDVPSEKWLGSFSSESKVRNSGLWNQNHVHKRHEPDFLDRLESLIDRTNSG